MHLSYLGLFVPNVVPLGKQANVLRILNSKARMCLVLTTG